MTLFLFVVLAFGPLVLDLYHRKDGEVSLSSATIWSCIYVGSALLFASFLYVLSGVSAANLFLSGYAIEKSLSLDNLMVFAAIFAYFGIPDRNRYRVLHYGIAGSVVLRLLFISFGLAMFAVFGRLLDLAFGVFVIWTATRLDKETDHATVDHGSRWYIRWTKKVLPVTPEASDRFFLRAKRGWFDAAPTATPLFLCLVAIEFTDIAFAFDSVPAVIGVTRDPLLVYAAIMFAVIGLRSLYFVMDALMRYTHNLQAAIMVVLLFVGVKMLVHGVLGKNIPAGVTLLVVVSAIAWGVGTSMVKARPDVA
jgi:tellurite resistance protein TerC